MLIISPRVVNTRCDPEDTGKTLKYLITRLSKQNSVRTTVMCFFCP